MSVDYFGKYFNDNGFDFSALINDDFIQPVRVLFNAKHYVSAAKLLLVAIDSMSFIEYGNIPENTFIKWLNEYSEIGRLDITPEELWEQRNSLLHMSNLSSRKVQQGKVRSLVAHVGKLPPNVNLNVKDTGYYELYELIMVVGQAVGNWLNTYGDQREKIHSFVERYDLIASDARMQYIHYETSNDS